MDIKIRQVFEKTPSLPKRKLLEIRECIFSVSNALKVENFEETLKWGQVSYLCKHGSTIRIGWDEKHSEQVSIFFNCNSSIVETAKEIYGDRLRFKGNREVVFMLDEILPQTALEDIIAMGLVYHQIKHKQLLGR